MAVTQAGEHVLKGVRFRDVASNADLINVASTINTVDKYQGKLVYNTTSLVPMFAKGAQATDLWESAEGGEASPTIEIYTSSYASLNDAVTDLGVTVATLYIDNATVLTADLVVPDTIAVVKMRQGSISGAFDLSILGGLYGDMTHTWFGLTTVVLEIQNTPVIYPEMFGAVGDGVTTTTDTDAWQAALDVIGPNVSGLLGKTYEITTPLRVTRSNLEINGNGCSIHQSDGEQGGMQIGWDGSAFLKTDNITLRDIHWSGETVYADDPAYCMVVHGPTTYARDTGCTHVKLLDLTATGFTGGVVGVGTTDLEVTGCKYGGMQYHAVTDGFAGGYGVLLSGTQATHIHHNTFIGIDQDRHAIYVSVNTAIASSQCQQTSIHDNIIDWTDMVAHTSAECAIALRAPIECNISGNIIRGSFHGIVYNGENDVGRSLTICNNTIRETRANSTGILISGDNGYRLKNLVISGNNITVQGTGSVGIQVKQADMTAVTGNSILTYGASNIGLAYGDCNILGVSSNTFNIDAGGIVMSHNSTTNNSSDVTIGMNCVTGSSYVMNAFYGTAPIEYPSISYGFVRQFSVSTDGVGNITYSQGYDKVIESVAVDVNGVKVTFQPWVDLGSANITFNSAGSLPGQVYRRSTDTLTREVVFGFQNSSGTHLPGVSQVLILIGAVLR